MQQHTNETVEAKELAGLESAARVHSRGSEEALNHCLPVTANPIVFLAIGRLLLGQTRLKPVLNALKATLSFPTTAPPILTATQIQCVV